MLSAFKEKEYNSLGKKQGNTKQFIIFSIDNQDYGVDVLNSKEILTITDLTIIPDAPHYIKGVIDLRGEIVPIVDIAKRFNIETNEKNEAHKVIIITVDNILMGLEVSDVKGIVSINGEDIADVPDITKNKDYIKGVAKQQGKILVLLDISKVFHSDEISDMERVI